jgi:hypothetical protein
MVGDGGPMAPSGESGNDGAGSQRVGGGSTDTHGMQMTVISVCRFYVGITTTARNQVYGNHFDLFAFLTQKRKSNGSI